jgi:hypothetical protein
MFPEYCVTDVPGCSDALSNARCSWQAEGVAAAAGGARLKKGQRRPSMRRLLVRSACS